LFQADAMKNLTFNAYALHCRIFVVVGALTFPLAIPMHAQNSPPDRIGIPEDWTHHHAVFADPGTAEQAIQNGNFDRWVRTVNDPRYQLQLVKRIAAARVPTQSYEPRSSADSDLNADDPDPPNQAPLLQLPRGLIKANSDSSLVDTGQRARDRNEFRFSPERARRRHDGEKLDWSETLGSGGSLGLGNYPAKFSFSTSTSSCTDWVVYGTGLPGSATQATILAYTNLYTTTCSGSVPAIAWAFNTGSGSSVLTSPVLSLDGTQIAFVQNGSTGASLVILKWAAGGTLTAPATPAPQASASAYRSCTAPCMLSINFRGAATDSGSSAWYDYNIDTVWVGDDNGVLHKFTGVFAGSPTEVATGGWPVTVSVSPLNGPIRDPVTGNVFVGDYALSVDSPCTPSSSNTNSPCGFLYSYNSSSGALIAKSVQLDFNFGLVGTAVLDEFAGQLYVPVGSDGETGAATRCGKATPCAAVFQLPTNFSNGASGTEATVGPGFVFLLMGAFDNEYLTSANASSPTGHMYVVGNTGAANNALYQISINANVMSTASVAGPTVAQNFTNGYFASGLGVTEFFNGARDYVFLSTLAFSNYSGCGATPSVNTGCVVGFDVTSGSISGSTLPTGSSPVAGGATGIIVDNAGSGPGESNIYLSALANQTCTTSGGSSGCAIQIAQSAP
jgi:hypothetical protein